MRILIPVLSVLALAACEPTGVNTQGGVGFQDYSAYQQQQAYLSRSRGPVRPQATASAAAAPVAPASAQITSGPITSGPITSASATGAPLSALNPNAAITSNAGISDEQNFDAVASRETIESDRERLERQRAEYQAIAPTALPERTGPSGPNIAAFALATSHPVGQQMYRRSNPFRNSQFERACARFASDSLAQEEFLRRGGPERDRLNLDPDGDGYACRWDPTPFRFVRG